MNEKSAKVSQLPTRVVAPSLTLSTITNHDLDIVYV